MLDIAQAFIGHYSGFYWALLRLLLGIAQAFVGH
jgi:hypothetical protein